MKIFPFIDEIGQVQHGDIIRAPHACLGTMRKKCQAHYAAIKCGELVRCPYGLYSYLYENGGISTAIMIRGKNTKELRKYIRGDRVQCNELQNVKKHLGSDDVTVIDQPIAPIVRVAPLLETPVSIDRPMAQPTINRQNPNNEKSVLYMRDLLHDLRLINGRMFDAIDILTKEVGLPELVAKRIGNLEASTEIMRARMQVYDVLSEEREIRSDDLYDIGIHGAFLKAHRVNAMFAYQEGVKLKHQGECRGKLRAHNTFAIVPFLIFDNAIKYTPDHNSILATFDESPNHVVVTVQNIGPTLSAGECVSVLKRGERGASVKAAKKRFEGQGIGLYVVEKICKMHGIDIKIESDQCRFKSDGIPYSLFTITLSIPRSG